MLHWSPTTFEISNFFFHLHTTTSSARVAICTLQIALTFLWFFGMESEKKGFFAPPMAFQPSVHTATWLEWLGSCHVAQFMSLHAKNGCWVKKRTNLRSRSIKTRENPIFADKWLHLCFQRRNFFTKKNVTVAFDERNTVSLSVGP